MDGEGSFTVSRLHYPSPALWEWVLLPLYSGDSGVGIYDPWWSDAHAQGETLSNLGAVRYGLPCQLQAGATNTNVGLRGPPQF